MSYTDYADSIDAFRALLQIDRHNLDHELERQGQTYERIGHFASKAATRMNEAKDNLASVEARLTGSIGDSDGRRVTKDQVAAAVQRHPDKQRAWTAYQVAREEHEGWEHLLNAWRARGFAISKLAELYVANYFTMETSIRRERPTRQNEHEELRKVAAEARKRRHLRST